MLSPAVGLAAGSLLAVRTRRSATLVLVAAAMLATHAGTAVADTGNVLRCEFDNQGTSAEFPFTVADLHGSTGCLFARRVTRGVLASWSKEQGLAREIRVKVHRNRLTFRCRYQKTPSPTHFEDSDNGPPPHQEDLPGAITRTVCQRAARIVRLTLRGTGGAAHAPPSTTTNDDTGR